jgi:hypothetical protein
MRGDPAYLTNKEEWIKQTESLVGLRSQQMILQSFGPNFII